MTDRYSKEFLNILDTTVWGTSGTLYAMHDLKHEFDKYRRPHYITLEKANKPVAVCLMNEKSITFQNRKYPAYYLSVLSVIPEERNKGYASLLVAKATGFFRGLLPEKGLIYAYVEKENERSHKTFRKSGYVDIGTFTAPVYSCLNPRKKAAVDKIKAEDAATVIDHLRNLYKFHAFLDLESSFDAGSYYVEKENDTIVTGMQAKRFRWSFLELPGLDGKIILKLFPHLPVVRNLFNPRNYEFLKIGNIYFKEGYESRIPVMIEALLAKENLKVCMAYTNTRSIQNMAIAAKVKHGLLSSVDAEANVYSHFKGFSEEESALFQKEPLHISLSDSV
jgi:RimJ/RimL family protein N-acetyltransferase